VESPREASYVSTTFIIRASRFDSNEVYVFTGGSKGKTKGERAGTRLSRTFLSQGSNSKALWGKRGNRSAEGERRPDGKTGGDTFQALALT